MVPLVNAEVFVRCATVVPSSFQIKLLLVWMTSTATQFFPGEPTVSKRVAGKIEV
jgi:hypothetical protein